MGTIWIILLTLLTGEMPAGLPAKDAQAATAVSLCTLVAHASDYKGRRIRLTANLVSGSEFSYLWDESCSRENPLTGKADLVEPVFGKRDYDFKSRMHRKLTRLLKRNQQAEVTVVGVFTDPGKYFGNQLCCRYKLEIQTLISVKEAAKTSTGTDSIIMRKAQENVLARRLRKGRNPGTGR